MKNHRPKELINQVPLVQNERATLEPDTLVVENRSLRKGFTLTPNYILRDQTVSFGAKLTYTLLLSYAWQAGSCFPGQTRLGSDLGVTRKAVNKYLKELREKGFVTWTRRGMGKTNVYYILDYPSQNEADVTQRLHQDVTARSDQDVPRRLHKKYAVEKDPEEEYSKTSKFRKAQRLENSGKNRVRRRGSLAATISLPEKENPSQKEEFSSKIAHVLERFSKHDLHDPAHTVSNITRAMNLWRRSQLGEEEFIGLLGSANKITFGRSGSVRKQAGYMGLKNLAPYFFKVLDDLIQQTTIEKFRRGFAAGKTMA